MKRSGQCPKCQSTDIFPDEVIRRPGVAVDGLRISVSKKSTREGFFARMFKSHASAELRAWVCGHCGYTELYTKHSLSEELVALEGDR